MSLTKSRAAILFGILLVVNMPQVLAAIYADHTLVIRSVTFDPPFISASAPLEGPVRLIKLKIAVQITDLDPHLMVRSLRVERMIPRFEGGEAFRRLTWLRDDGKHGDAIPGDGVFTGIARFRNRSCGLQSLRVAGWIKAPGKHPIKSVSTLFDIPSTTALVPAASIVDTRILIQEHQRQQFESIQFDVEKAGSAILRLNNGAKLGGSRRKRVRQIEATLNGKRVLAGRKFNRRTDCLELRVPVIKGTNELLVAQRGRAGTRTSLRIDAPADEIVLDSIPNAVVLGDAVKAMARVSSLGKPVQGAAVEFVVAGLGDVPMKSATTDQAGTAGVTIGEIAEAGVGYVLASVQIPQGIIEAQTAIRVVVEPTLLLERAITSTTVQTGEQVPVDYLVRVSRNSVTPYEIVLQQDVAPDPSGVVATLNFPMNGLMGAGSNTFIVRSFLTPMTPGTHTVITTATILGLDEEAQDDLILTVRDAGTPQPLILSTPHAEPSALRVGASAMVRFTSAVSGTNSPPEILVLDQIDNFGEIHTANIAMLRDDGRGPDLVSGDFIFSGETPIEGARTVDLFYRARAEYSGETVVSSAYRFHVTEFQLSVTPVSELTVIPDEAGDIYADVILLGFPPSTTRSRIEDILRTDLGVTDLTRVALIPAIDERSDFDLYEVKVPNGNTAQQLKNIVAELQKRDEVSCAQIQSPPMPQSPFPNDDSQVSMAQIRAEEAWLIIPPANETVLAILDDGIDCEHEDLQNKILTSPTTGEKLGADCDAAEPAGSSCSLNVCPDAGTGQAHGTQVAGVAAADSNNDGTGIAGVSWYSKILPIRAGGSQASFCAGLNLASGEAKVILFAKTWGVEIDCVVPRIEAARHTSLLVFSAADLNQPPAGLNPMFPNQNTGGVTANGVVAVGISNASGDEYVGNPSSVDIAAPGYNVQTTIPNDNYT